jgi:hypothetical protein
LINQFGSDYLNDIIPRAREQTEAKQKPYTFPKNSDLKVLKETGRKIIKLVDIFWVLKFALGKVKLDHTIQK